MIQDTLTNKQAVFDGCTKTCAAQVATFGTVEAMRV